MLLRLVNQNGEGFGDPMVAIINLENDVLDEQDDMHRSAFDERREK